MKRRYKLAVAVLGCFAVPGVAVAAYAPTLATDASSSPSVVTDPATHITDTTAVLNATINPNGASTTYTFAWGPTTAYGYTSKGQSAGHGTKPVAVHLTITGLVPGTVYHFHVLSLNGSGGSLGADRSFRTTGHPPAGVFTGPALSIGATVATLSGIVNPNGAATQWLFQYGTTPSVTTSTGGGTVPAGASTAVVEPLSGLAPGTLFYYRLVGLHGLAVASYGAIQSFYTYPSPRLNPHVTARTTPGRDRNKPFVFTTTGRVSAVTSIPAQVACGGSNVIIAYYFGAHKLGFAAAPVNADCTFATQAVFAHKFGRLKQRRSPEQIRIVIHFRGDGYLAPANARDEKVTIG